MTIFKRLPARFHYVTQLGGKKENLFKEGNGHLRGLKLPVPSGSEASRRGCSYSLLLSRYVISVSFTLSIGPAIPLALVPLTG